MSAPKNLFLRNPSMWLAGAAFLLQAKLGRRYAKIKRNGITISCGIAPGQGKFCAIAGLDYEPELRWLIRHLSPGDAFIDVGANIGVYSLHAAKKVSDAGRVISIEPGPGAAAVLRRNVELNHLTSLIQVVQAAASSQPGNLYLSGDPDRWHALQLSPVPPGQHIPVVTVDNIAKLAGAAPVTAIKIDAEGVEFDVLLGAKQTIERFHPAIIFEDLIARTAGSASQWLTQNGYLLHIIDPEDGKLVPLGKGRHSDNIIAISSGTNSKFTSGERSLIP